MGVAEVAEADAVIAKAKAKLGQVDLLQALYVALSG